MTYLPDDGEEESGYEIPDFGVGVGVGAGDGADGLDASWDFLAGPAVDVEFSGPEVTDETAPIPVVSVSNPDQTVTATASIDGRLQGVTLDLGSRSGELSEHELAREILLVAQLAWTSARAELFDLLLERTSEAGDDVEATRRFLHDDVGLPTSEQAAAEQADAFAARLRGTDD